MTFDLACPDDKHLPPELRGQVPGECIHMRARTKGASGGSSVIAVAIGKDGKPHFVEMTCGIRETNWGNVRASHLQYCKSFSPALIPAKLIRAVHLPSRDRWLFEREEMEPFWLGAVWQNDHDRGLRVAPVTIEAPYPISVISLESFVWMTWEEGAEWLRGDRSPWLASSIHLIPGIESIGGPLPTMSEIKKMRSGRN